MDGDGYIFKSAFLKDAAAFGGAHAANQLYTEVQNYLKANNISSGGHYDLEVMVNVYANKTGLAKALSEAEMINAPIMLDPFFCSFTQSRPLFQFIDCGPGKERADAKIRGILLARHIMDAKLTSCPRYVSVLRLQQSLPTCFSGLLP